MFEFALRLFDSTGFEPDGTRGPWTPALRWLHIGGDFFIWLACISIAFVLFYFARRRLPHSRLLVLFALLFLAIGFGHLLEALMFRYPIYRFAGVWKALTAGLAWAATLVLIPVVPRVTALARGPTPADAFGDTTLHRLT